MGELKHWYVTNAHIRFCGTKASTNTKHKFYNSTVHAISKGVGYCATKAGSLCGSFVYMGYLFRTQVQNGLSKLFDFRGQNIDVSDKSFQNLKVFGS